MITECLGYQTESREITVDYSQSGKNISLVKNLVGKSGWMKLTKLSIDAFESEDILVLTTVTDSGDILDQEISEKILSV